MPRHRCQGDLVHQSSDPLSQLLREKLEHAAQDVDLCCLGRRRLAQTLFQAAQVQWHLLQVNSSQLEHKRTQSGSKHAQVPGDLSLKCNLDITVFQHPHPRS